MAVTPDPQKTRSFPDAAGFERWLATHHERESELWLKLHKAGSGLPSISAAEAIEVALCWGWIDGIRKAFDARSFLQRFTPRRAKSRWSQINRDKVARLIAAGRMQPAGMRHVDAAKADGRWELAYASPSSMTLPDDLLRAIEAVPAAAATLRGLNRQNQYALAYRVHHLKTAAARARRIEAFVAMLARGETPHPNTAARGAASPAAQGRVGVSRGAAKKGAAKKGAAKRDPAPPDGRAAPARKKAPKRGP